MFEAMESFEWATPELLSTVDVGPNTLRIKGIALRGGALTKNNRKYSKEDLSAAARSFIGKPVTVNHDSNKIIGDVHWMEWNELQNTLEYIADVKKQPYVSMLRSGNAEIKGVSIQGNYLKNLCVHCGKEFLDDDGLWNHLREDHLVKNFSTQPWGLYGTALSLVLDPEIPGYPDTTIELMEWYKPAWQLLETVITKRKKIEENEKALTKANVNVQPVARTAMGKSQTKPQLKTAEQEEPSAPEACPEGEHRDPDTGECVPDVTEQEEPEACPVGQHRDPETGECVPDKPPEVSEELLPPAAQEPAWTPPECTEGSHWDEELAICVPDTSEPATAPISAPALEKLELGEPFADYDSFADCVSKNSDKDDPEAYCAQIQRQTEGEPVSESLTRQTFEQYQLVEKHARETLNRRITVLTEATRGYGKDIVAVKKYIEQDRLDHSKIIDAVNKTRDSLSNIVEQCNKGLLSFQETQTRRENIWKASLANVAKHLKAVESRKPFDPSTLNPLLSKLRESLSTLQGDLRKIGVSAADQIKELKEELAQTKEAYSTILGGVDKKYKEYKVDMEKKLEEAKKEKEAAEQKKIEETTKDKEKLTERLENVEENLKKLSEFKGQVQKDKKQDTGMAADNPYRGK